MGNAGLGGITRILDSGFNDSSSSSFSFIPAL